MLLSARILQNVSGVNDWEHADQLKFTEGDTLYVHFQLIDSNKDRQNQGFKPSGKRYIPATGATLQATIQNVNSAKTLVKTAVQPYSGDLSIWRIQLTSSDALSSGTFSVNLSLTESGVVTRGVIKNALSVEPQSGIMT